MTVLVIIFTSIFTLVSFLLGYFIGKNDIDLEDVKGMLPESKEKPKRITRKRIGVIERPTAIEVEKRGSIIEETEREMTKQFVKQGIKPNE